MLYNILVFCLHVCKKTVCTTKTSMSTKNLLFSRNRSKECNKYHISYACKVVSYSNRGMVRKPLTWFYVNCAAKYYYHSKRQTSLNLWVDARHHQQVQSLYSLCLQNQKEKRKSSKVKKFTCWCINLDIYKSMISRIIVRIFL